MTFHHVNKRVRNFSSHWCALDSVHLRAFDLILKNRILKLRWRRGNIQTVLNLCIFQIHSSSFKYSCAIKYFTSLLCETEKHQSQIFQKNSSFCLLPLQSCLTWCRSLARLKISRTWIFFLILEPLINFCCLFAFSGFGARYENWVQITKNNKTFPNRLKSA